MNEINPKKITTISIKNKTKWRLDELRRRLGTREGYDKLLNALLDNLEEQEEKQKEVQE
jgi:hypothetical protein